MKKLIMSQWFVDVIAGLIAGGMMSWALIGLGLVK